MPGTALALYVAFIALAFGLRTWIQIRRTGSSGFHGISGRPGSAEWTGGVLFVVAIVAGVAAPVAQLSSVLEPVGVLDRPAILAVGLVLAVAGLVATVAAQRSMGSSWRIGVDPQERTALVTSGAFALARNPIFSAMLLAALGLALLAPNAVALGAVALLFVAVETQVRIVEEPHLRVAHGQAFADYERRVGRFAPRPSQRPGLGRHTTTR